MAEFMLEESTGPAGPGGFARRSEALSPILSRIKTDGLTGRWFKIARYDKRTSAGGAMDALKETFGTEPSVSGWTFALSRDVDGEGNALSKDTLIMCRYDPENIVPGADAEHQKFVAARREDRRRKAAEQRAKRKERRAAGGGQAGADARAALAADAGDMTKDGVDADVESSANVDDDTVVDGAAVTGTPKSRKAGK